jgi:NitT/TauT family transport system substrate-binding protein
MQIIQQNRRDFLTSASLAAAAGVLGPRAALADEGPPETTTIRLSKIPGICIAPQYVVEELLRAEGFNDVRYVAAEAGRHSERMARGELDFSLNFAAPLVLSMPAMRSRSCPVCTPAALSCSRMSASAASWT